MSWPALPGSDRRFIVGRDTRRSGPLLQAALSAGLASEGVDVTDVGVLATPAVAYLSAEQAAPAAVISASHNPYWDNGVKFFSSGGSKLPDAVEDALEAELEVMLSHPSRRLHAAALATFEDRLPCCRGASAGRSHRDRRRCSRTL